MGTGYSIFSDEADIREELRKVNQQLDDIKDMMRELQEIKELLQVIAASSNN